MAQVGVVSIVTARPGATAGCVWSAALLKGAPGLLEEVVKTFVAAVHGLTSAFHGGLDVLDREQGCAAPVRRLRLFFSHDREVPRCLARASHTMADIYLQAREQAVDEPGEKRPDGGACLAAPTGPLQAKMRARGEAVSRRFAVGPSGRLLRWQAGIAGLLAEVGRPSSRAGRRGASPGARCFWALGRWSLPP
jgi:hypothetical protein